ncbi:hypothetical protein [Lacinutrix mariniflava]|uniref:hypothetical protein n=1 Tax=Lacinutrix mariniflava TaxID=342955 RepID=UPI0006E12168|nr:hypothetical protein [Lacinutrix mariniflava]
MNLNLIQKNLTIIALAVALGWVLTLDFSNLSWEVNKMSYYGIGIMLFLALITFIKYKGSKN